jgi:hypothetical protein
MWLNRATMAHPQEGGSPGIMESSKRSVRINLQYFAHLGTCRLARASPSEPGLGGMMGCSSGVPSGTSDTRGH